MAHRLQVYRDRVKRLRPDRSRRPGLLAPWLILFAIVLVVPTSGIRGGSALTEGTAAGTAAGASAGLGGVSIGANCSHPSLEWVVLSPENLSLAGLTSYEFYAEAISSCLTDLTNQTVFSWSLSSPDLGTLSASSGISTTYTACLSPMDGALSVSGTFGGATLSANATISVTFPSYVTNGSGAGSPQGLQGGTVRYSVNAAGLALSVVLGAIGVTIGAWGVRGARRARRLERAQDESTPSDGDVVKTPPPPT